MQTRSSDENSACLSVRRSLSVSLSNVWWNESNIYPHSYTTWKIIYPSFVTRRMVGRGDPFNRKFWVNQPPLERNRQFCTDIHSLRLSRNTYAKKVHLTLIGSPLRAFHWAQDEYHTLSLSPKGRGSKTQSVQNLNNKLRKLAMTFSVATGRRRTTRWTMTKRTHTTQPEFANKIRRGSQQKAALLIN